MLTCLSSLSLASFVAIFTAAAQSPPPEREAVEATMMQFIEARNARDAEAVAAFFADDYDQGDLTTGAIQITSGEARRNAYRAAFVEGRMRNEMQYETKRFRLLADGVALLDAGLSFVDASGSRQLANFATFIFVQRDGRWLIGAVRMSPLSE